MNALSCKSTNFIVNREKYSDDHPWPRMSPVARVYDIDYTPTKLVLINEKARPKVSVTSARWHHDRYKATLLHV